MAGQECSKNTSSSDQFPQFCPGKCALFTKCLYAAPHFFAPGTLHPEFSLFHSEQTKDLLPKSPPPLSASRSASAQTPRARPQHQQQGSQSWPHGLRVCVPKAQSNFLAQARGSGDRQSTDRPPCAGATTPPSRTTRRSCRTGEGPGARARSTARVPALPKGRWGGPGVAGRPSLCVECRPRAAPCPSAAHRSGACAGGTQQLWGGARAPDMPPGPFEAAPSVLLRDSFPHHRDPKHGPSSGSRDTAGGSEGPKMTK